MQILKGLKRFRIKKSRTDIAEVIVDSKRGLDVGALRSGHVGCSACGEPWWFVEKLGRLKVRVGCVGCGYELVLFFVGGQWNPDWERVTGELVCPWCKLDEQVDCKKFAVIKQAETVSVGCKRCSWDWRCTFKRENLLWIPN